MKHIWISAVLAVIFVIFFMVQVDRSPLGPSSPAEIDDLGISGAFFDAATNKLLLVTSQGWAELSLQQLIEASRGFKYDISPAIGNSLHEGSIVQESNLPPEFRSGKPVALLTGKYASFNYYHYPPDGRARKDNDNVATIPDGYDMALYRSDNETPPDRKTFLRSYILVTRERQADGRCGYQFFYNPDVGTSLSLQFPNQNASYLPAFLSICIALPLAFSSIRGAASWLLFTLAIGLNALSWLLFSSIARFGQAFGNYEKSSAPFPLLLSAIILVALVGVKLGRTSGGAAQVK
jgi:hypothetical protein